jgi:tetratricopeptide (TPR) repeat protein
MRKQLQRAAWDALMNGDHALAASYWIQGHCLPEDDATLTQVYEYANTKNEASTDPDLCAILGLIALDNNDIFDHNRERALIQCVQWSKRGLEIDLEHYSCNRHAGSALYWLGDKAAAEKYYAKANELSASPVLQIRLAHIRGSAIEISIDTQEGMEAYNGGVELNRLLATQPELKPLKRLCYERAYSLFHGAIFEQNGDLLNYNPEIFAMCCTNLSQMLTEEGNFERAITILDEGIAQCTFMTILVNRFHTYIQAGMPEQAIADGERLLEAYTAEMDTVTYFDTIDGICNSCMELKRYEDALELSEIGLREYYELDATDPVTQDEHVMRCFTNFFINKAKAAEVLGIKVENDPGEMDQLLETMPDNPSLLISKANTFTEEKNWEKAMECYQYAIHFASQKGMDRSVQVALYNMGYMQAVHLDDKTGGLDSLEGSIGMGNVDFWCYYWAMFCAYQLTENEKTVHYGELALQALAGQEGVTDDVVAQIYEHIGTSCIDLDECRKAVQYLQESVKLYDTEVARQNLQIAKEHV